MISMAWYQMRLCNEKEHAATEERLPLPVEPSKDGLEEYVRPQTLSK